VKQPAGLSRDDGKCPDGVTLLPWAKGKPLAWDVTVQDTYADSHLADTATPADKAASNKEAKYRQLANCHIFVVCTSSHRVSRDLEPPSSGISAGAGQTNDSRHWRHQGGDLPVPADVSGSSTGKCGLLPQHFNVITNYVISCILWTTVYIHHRHLLLVIPKADTHFTTPQRIEG